MINESITPLAGTRANAAAISATELAAIARPPSAALTVAGLSFDSRARSVAAQPRRAISWRSRPG